MPLQRCAKQRIVVVYKWNCVLTYFENSPPIPRISAGLILRGALGSPTLLREWAGGEVFSRDFDEFPFPSAALGNVYGTACGKPASRGWVDCTGHICLSTSGAICAVLHQDQGTVARKGGVSCMDVKVFRKVRQLAQVRLSFQGTLRLSYCLCT